MHPDGTRVSAAILLAGGLRPSPIVAEIGRSVLDLHLTRQRTGLELWLARLDELGEMLAPGFRVRVIHGGTGVVPREPRWTPEGVVLSIESHRGEFRGPAGIARDAASSEDPDALLLIAEAARFCGSPLAPLIERHKSLGADVTVATNPDGTPAGIYLVRAGCLSIVPEIGFTDLKEQWLTRARGAGYAVWCDRFGEPGAMPLRTREDCVRAARAAAGQSSDLRRYSMLGRLDGVEDGVSVVAPGAVVEPGAVVRDSIICEGAVIGAGAVVVRSVVAPGARVEAGAAVVDLALSGFGMGGTRNGRGRGGVL